eukprot:SAG31_NODE_832_length_11660_cov_2.612091_1_plen_407_part_10
MDSYSLAPSAAAAIVQPKYTMSGLSNKRPRESHQATERALKTHQTRNNFTNNLNPSNFPQHNQHYLPPPQFHYAQQAQPYGQQMYGGYNQWVQPLMHWQPPPCSWNSAGHPAPSQRTLSIMQPTGEAITPPDAQTPPSPQTVSPSGLMHAVSSVHMQHVASSMVPRDRRPQIHSYASRIAYGSGPRKDIFTHGGSCSAQSSNSFKRDSAGPECSSTALCRKTQMPQSNKVFVGGLPQTVTEWELLQYFEKVGGPIADVVLVKDHTNGRLRGFGFVMFRDLESVNKVVVQDSDRAQQHELRPGIYVDVKRALSKQDAAVPSDDSSAEASDRAATRLKHQSNTCQDCGKRNPKYGMPNEKRKRWCGDCAQKNHPEAVKNRSIKERAQREDRSHVFQWARNFDQPRCAYW